MKNPRDRQFGSRSGAAFVALALALAARSLVVAPSARGATKATKTTKARFTARLDSASLAVAQNSVGNVTVLVDRVGSFAGPITLKSSTRKGLTVRFDENPLLGDDTDLVVSASPTATLTSTTLTVSATDGRTTVRMRLRLKVTKAKPTTTVSLVTATSATTAAPATTVAGSATSSSSTVASSSSTTTTLPATTTTTTTTTTSTTTTTTPRAASGDLIITRKVSQAARCAQANAQQTLVKVTLTNTGTSARRISEINPGSCSEGPTFATLPAGASGFYMAKPGSIVVVRSDATAGNPIRVVYLVREAAAFDVSGSMLVRYVCRSVGPSGAVPVADDGRLVLSVPSGSTCEVSTGDANPAAVTDNIGSPTDGSASVLGRPATCPAATASSPVPGPAGCYVEFVVSN